VGPNSAIHFCGDAVERHRALLNRPGGYCIKWFYLQGGQLRGVASVAVARPAAYSGLTPGSREQRHHHEALQVEFETRRSTSTDRRLAPSVARSIDGCYRLLSDDTYSEQC
jgi:hypothetical protein